MISVIVAISQNGVIGCDNRLLWHITEDMRRFRALTTGHAVVMGRKTWESIGRPLPNRTNIVLTRQKDYVAEGCAVFDGEEIDITKIETAGEVFVIGGGEIYRQLMPIAERLYLTIVHRDYEGDTLFPEIDLSQWEEESREYHERGVEFEYPFEFIYYRRK